MRDNWSPLGFLRPDGFRYWLPAVLRLLITEDADGVASRLPEYLEDPHDARFLLLTPEERAAVTHFLRHVAWWRPDVVGEWEVRRRFERTLAEWEAVSGVGR